jgi:hypothetical protein
MADERETTGVTPASDPQRPVRPTPPGGPSGSEVCGPRLVGRRFRIGGGSRKSLGMHGHYYRRSDKQRIADAAFPAQGVGP